MIYIWIWFFNFLKSCYKDLSLLDKSLSNSLYIYNLSTGLSDVIFLCFIIILMIFYACSFDIFKRAIKNNSIF
jgi:hypothetical protein